MARIGKRTFAQAAAARRSRLRRPSEMSPKELEKLILKRARDAEKRKPR